MRARFIDAGLLHPAEFHATYAAVAVAAAGAVPAVVWGRARAHVALGACQSRDAELAPELEVEAVVRPLGGGAVWVDESQYCFVLIAPRAAVPARPAQWPAWGLAPAIATFRRFGLRVTRRGDDLWLAGRKIAGSGTATLGASAVLASSFLMRFPLERFARAIAVPSPAFGAWLRDGLRQAMTDWASHAPLPDADALRTAFREAVGSTLGWQLEDSGLNPAEQAARAEAMAEAAERDAPDGARRVPGGIKLNDAMALTERLRDGVVVRELTVDGRAVRRASRRG
jgi:lipoate---protein ligase